MRKTGFTLVLILSLALLSACAHTSQTAATGTTAATLDAIVQKGELVVGTAASMPPFNMTTKDGEIIGFEPDLARLIAAGMGVPLKLTPMSFSELLPALETGKIDMILSNMTMTPRRNLKVAFVGPYFISGKAFLTKEKTIANAKRRLTLVQLILQVFLKEVLPRKRPVFKCPKCQSPMVIKRIRRPSSSG